MRRLAALLVLTLAALMPSEAHLSKVYHQDVSLLELVNQTSWALVVRLDTPPTRVVTVPYSLTSRDGAPMESIYGVPVVRVIIEEVLRAEDETPSVGAALELYEPETLTMFELTLRYEATGPDKADRSRVVEDERGVVLGTGRRDTVVTARARGVDGTDTSETEETINGHRGGLGGLEDIGGRTGV